MQDLEADRVERTISTNKIDKFCEAVCAFANDFPGLGLPGYLLLGVTDAGVPSGLRATDELLRTLGGIRSDGNIQPLPSLSIQVHRLEEGDVAVVEVLPSIMPPVRYKGRVWIRVGPRRATASEEEERRLVEKRVARALTFDLQPCQGANLDELSLDLFVIYRTQAIDKEVIEANGRKVEQQLASLRFYDLKNSFCTHAGIILFGKNPLYWLPGGYIQFCKFPGLELSDNPVQDKELSGDLLSVLRQLDEIIAVHNPERSMPETSLREKRVRDYPPFAVRELLMNALMHRSYESTAPVRFYWFADRIEIQNPGGLYGEATRENFPNQNAYRNPVIAEAMKTLGYVNRFGHGVLRAQALLRENGNPEAEFVFEDTYVLAKIRGKP
jgi:ATP-dependent DNA helicase RecG